MLLRLTHFNKWNPFDLRDGSSFISLIFHAILFTIFFISKFSLKKNQKTFLENIYTHFKKIKKEVKKNLRQKIFFIIKIRDVFWEEMKKNEIV